MAKNENQQDPQDELDDPLAPDTMKGGPFLWAALIIIPIFLILLSAIFQPAPEQEQVSQAVKEEVQRESVRRQRARNIDQNRPARRGSF